MTQTMPALSSKQYLADLQKLVKKLDLDLKERSEEAADVKERLEAQYQEARQAGRTQETYATWRAAYLNQVAVAWVLSCVFVRYLEDNRLIDEAWLAGTDEDKLTEAKERHDTYFRENPLHSDRDYLQHVFTQVARLPGCAELFDPARNPLWRVAVSGDGARELLEFWQAENTGAKAGLKRPFISPDTRFLGDLYQDLSQEARKRYALLQTPDFVEEFILDRTLEPALETFGLEGTNLIDPTCGSGHFLLGAFARVVRRWQATEAPRAAASKALAAVVGVDVNPFAVAIARFRLVIAFVQACRVAKLKECPDFHPQVFCGDSLLHGVTLTRVRGQHELEDYPADALVAGDYEDARRVLMRKYQAVVGNPPYITDSDRAHNALVRARYRSCHMKFSLGVPFTERFLDLAAEGRNGQKAGFVGMITTNSFMKREFGKKLIEEVLPDYDLTHIIDTSGAYIPGHGTPTVLLFGRHQRPTRDVVRAVLGIRGEPSTPADASQGLVWRSVVDNLDRPDSETPFVSVADSPRETFRKHPWSMGGGGAGELLEVITRGKKQLGEHADSIGITCFTLEDDVYVQPSRVLTRSGIPKAYRRGMVEGDGVRDFCCTVESETVFPYSNAFTPFEEEQEHPVHRYLWTYRTNLGNSKMFGQKTKLETGLRFFEWGRLTYHKLLTPLSITFAEMTTHNHFVLDRGGKVFNRTAPVIKLPEGTAEAEHLALVGPLNSSVTAFVLRQTCYVKNFQGIQTVSVFDNCYQFSAAAVGRLSIPRGYARTLEIARALDLLAREGHKLEPTDVTIQTLPSRPSLDQLKSQQESLHLRRVALQEELDWHCYELYGITEKSPLHPLDTLPPVQLGERAFEIALARAVEAGEEETTWFERHRSTPRTTIPDHWPDSYKQVVEERLRLIEENRFLQLLEQPEHKRRWQREPWETREKKALQEWILDRLESPSLWAGDPEPVSVHKIAEKVRKDAHFLSVLDLYEKDAELEPTLEKLIANEGVPFLAAYRYTDSGLEKRADWEKTWELQRKEDEGEDPGPIAVPPKYASGDFRQASYWRLRGKLDVPKERFILYPGAERDTDKSLVLGWAGWDHLQRAMALAEYYQARKEIDAWPTERLVPLLAGLLELVPWVKQWHNEVHPEYEQRMGDYYATMAEDEARKLGLTLDDLRNWRPEATARKTRKKKA